MIMESHLKYNDSDFRRLFEDLKLDPELFTHIAHLRLAWIYLEAYGITEAADKTCLAISNFDRAFGDGTKFHDTVTRMAVIIIAECKGLEQNAVNFQEFIAKHQELVHDFRQLIGNYYSWDIFADPKAKKEYIKPDILDP